MLDELASGVGPADAPTIARELSVDPGRLAGGILAGFFVLGLLIEPALLRWSERHAARWTGGGALVAIALICVGASLAPGPWMLLATFALYGPASGLAVSAAEGALVEAAPAHRERTMARITIAAALGDLAVPGLVALMGWRASFGACALLALALAAVVFASRALGRAGAADDDCARARLPSRKREGLGEGASSELPPPDPLPQAGGGDPAAAHDEEEDPEDAEPTTLREALRHRALVGWTALEASSGLMDEVAAAFAAVHIAARFEGAAPLATALTAWTLGNLAGLALLERLLARGHRPMRLLAIAAALAVPALAGVIFAHELSLLCAAVALFGACAATFYPVVKARAYAALPGEPGVVNALRALFTPLDVLVPLALGAIAELASPAAALGALGVVPLLVLVVALRKRS